MSSEQNVIYSPTYTPNQNWVKELDRRQIDSILSSFKAPINDKRIVTLCKPFVVLSKNAYSSPVTLPLGLAYVGAVIEKAGYKTKIIDIHKKLKSYPAKKYCLPMPDGLHLNDFGSLKYSKIIYKFISNQMKRKLE